nr:hypothetical protein [uncultured Blautia sp.]
MMTIKVNLKDDYIVIRINGTLTEIAEYYFGSHMGVETIEILDGWENENEYFKQTPIYVYRASKEDIEEFQLYENIRFRYRMEYKQGQAEDHIASCGLCRI